MSYTLFKNKDSVGKDIPLDSGYWGPYRSRKQIQSMCQNLCSARGNCGGYSYVQDRCYLKQNIPNPLSPADGINTYIKDSIIQNFPSYFYTNSDYNSNTQLKAYASANNVDLTKCTTDECKIQTVQKHMRENIDRKVAEIYQAPGTATRAFDENYQITMLTGVVWALLGTTVLYYTFKNI
jgi:hypothetical protein